MDKHKDFTERELVELRRIGFKGSGSLLSNGQSGVNYAYVVKTDNETHPYELFYNSYEFDTEHERYVCGHLSYNKTFEDMLISIRRYC